MEDVKLYDEKCVTVYGCTLKQTRLGMDRVQVKSNRETIIMYTLMQYAEQQK